MFEEFIKLERAKYESRINEIDVNLATIISEISTQKNLSGTHLDKTFNYKLEKDTLNEYLVVINNLPESKEDKLDKLEVVKTAANEVVKTLQKKMDAIYLKYPEEKEFSEDNEDIIRDIDLLQGYILRQEKAKARYRICLSLLNELNK